MFWVPHLDFFYFKECKNVTVFAPFWNKNQIFFQSEAFSRFIIWRVWCAVHGRNISNLNFDLNSVSVTPRPFVCSNTVSTLLFYLCENQYGRARKGRGLRCYWKNPKKRQGHYQRLTGDVFNTFLLLCQEKRRFLFLPCQIMFPRKTRVMSSVPSEMRFPE